MKTSLIDISVLLIFFNRPTLLEKVFEQVKIARPTRLFLYQDGARNEDDISGITACREIVSNIDWECEVHQLYQDKNFGCDPSEYIAQKWAFSKTDKCIILEDDDVPTQSFFLFCKEMLDKYEQDSRIWMIAGFNHLEFYNKNNADYFFTDFMSISGWASWRRVIDTWDEKYEFLDDKKKISLIKQLIEEGKLYNEFINLCKSHKNSGKAHYETIMWSSMILNNGVAIIPQKNLINNIGISEDSTHFSTPPHMLPKGYRRIFTMGRYDLEFPLNHPKEFIIDTNYKDQVYRIFAWNHPWIKFGRSFEELFINLRHGNFKNISKSLKNRIFKLLHINT